MRVCGHCLWGRRAEPAACAGVEDEEEGVEMEDGAEEAGAKEDDEEVHSSPLLDTLLFEDARGSFAF